jgi:hypothetical protein
LYTLASMTELPTLNSPASPAGPPCAIAPFWDPPAGAVVLAIRSEDLPVHARSIVVQSRGHRPGSGVKFLAEARLSGAAGGDAAEQITYLLLLRPEQEPPFTLELFLGAEGGELTSWQQLSFASSMGAAEEDGGEHIAAYVLKDEDDVLRVQPDPQPAPLEDVRRLAAQAAASALFAAPLTQGRYGPARPVALAPAALHVLPLLRQRDAQERRRLEQELRGLPEEQRAARAKELELNLPDEWLNLYVGPFPSEAEAMAALERLEFGVIRYNFARTPDPADPRAARIGKLRGKHIGLRAWGARGGVGGGQLIRARFRELAHLDSVFAVSRDGTLLQEWDQDDAGEAAPAPPGRAIAFVFRGDRVLRDTRPLWDHGGCRQTPEEIATAAVQTVSGAPEGSITATVFTLFTQDLTGQGPKLLASLEQAAALFGLSPHRKEDVLGHANLFMGLHSKGARQRLLAAANGVTNASPEGGAMAIVRETLLREMPERAQQLSQWLESQADRFHLLWRAFIAGQDFASQVTLDATLPQGIETARSA